MSEVTIHQFLVPNWITRQQKTILLPPSYHRLSFSESAGTNIIIVITTVVFHAARDTPLSSTISAQSDNYQAITRWVEIGKYFTFFNVFTLTVLLQDMKHTIDI